MPDPRHEHLRRLFDRALVLPAAARAAFLDHKCDGDDELKRRLLAMLAAAEDEQFLAEPTVSGQDVATEPEEAPLREGPGSRIGPYKLLQQIGEGGFGVVFMAEQEKPVARRVALKVIKLGMDTRQVVARFEQERQALAMMDHPNIARVLDAGATETGRPYFVMDLVKGDPIVDYCDKNRLSIEARLELFAQVCTAVQHAHGKGIIHRDIKPSNILVGTQDGRPMAKVIDFGIAKATSQKLTDKTLFTEHQQVIGTLQYMSPEQAEGSLDIDTRTDVYSLGVLLYELLTGSTPFDKQTIQGAMFGELRRMIREVEPPKPSTRLHDSSASLASIAAQRGVEPRRLGVLVRGELDWIVMKALEKDRARRYETANGLAADVRRYLAGEAVVAAPPSASYRLRKFVRRNKGTVTTVGAVGVALLVGVVGFAWQATVAETQRDLAEQAGKAEAEQHRLADVQRDRAVTAEGEAKQRADELAKVADFQASMLSQIDATQAGTRLFGSIRAKFAASLQGGKLTDAEQQARIAVFDRDLLRVNATDTSAEMIEHTILEPAATAVAAQFKDQPTVAASLRQTLAKLYRGLGFFDPALPLQQQALATRRAVLGEDHPDTLQSLHDLGEMLENQGKLAEAETCYRDALTRRRKVLGEEHRATLGSMVSLGNLLRSRGAFAEAEPLLVSAVEKFRRVLGDADRDTLVAINCLGFLYVVQGKLAATEPLWREAYEKGLAALGEDDPDVLVWTNNLAGLLQEQNKLKEAEVLFRQAVAKYRRIRGDEYPDTLRAIGTLAASLYLQRRCAEAEPLYREALGKARHLLGSEHPFTLLMCSNLGLMLVHDNRLGEAEPLLREAVSGYRLALGDDNPETLGTESKLGTLLANQGKLAEAEALYRESLAKCRRALGDAHPQTLIDLVNLGNLLLQQRRPDDAEPLIREALAARRRVSGAEHPETLIALSNLGYVFEQQGKLAEAEATDREAFEQLRRVRGADHPSTMNSAAALARVLRLGGKPAAAEVLFRETLAQRQQQPDRTEAAVAEVQLGLGQALADQQRFAEAEPHLTAAEPVLAAAPAVYAARHRQCVESLVALYEAWDKSDPGHGHAQQAVPWRQKLAALPGDRK